MMDFLNWQSGDGIALSSQQWIAYQDENGNTTMLPPIQIIVAVESYPDNVYYPVVAVLNSIGKIIWRIAYRECTDFETAFNYAKREVEETFQGSYEDGILRHDILNGWAFEIMKGLGDGVISKSGKKLFN